MSENEKEFKKEEYKVELKFVGFLSVNNINELKEAIPDLIKKRIDSYNYSYLLKINEAMHSMNMQGYILCKISKYEGITEKEKEFMNSEVAQIRNEKKNGNWDMEFTDEQSEKILEIYKKMEREIHDTFNQSPLFKEKFQNTFILTEKEKKEVMRLK